MPSDSEDPERAADRLEAALERIAVAANRAEIALIEPPAETATGEIAARLDDLIDRLRAALGNKG